MTTAELVQLMDSLEKAALVEVDIVAAAAVAARCALMPRQARHDLRGCLPALPDGFIRPCGTPMRCAGVSNRP